MKDPDVAVRRGVDRDHAAPGDAGGQHRPLGHFVVRVGRVSLLPEGSREAQADGVAAPARRDLRQASDDMPPSWTRESKARERYFVQRAD